MDKNHEHRLNLILVKLQIQSKFKEILILIKKISRFLMMMFQYYYQMMMMMMCHSSHWIDPYLHYPLNFVIIHL
jgi:hypothetical protein